MSKEPKTIEHNPTEIVQEKVDWRRYRQTVLAQLHKHFAEFEAQPDGDMHKAATIRLAQALQPAFVVWCASEFGQHDTKNQTAFHAMVRALPWLFLHMGELIQGSNGPYVMARAIAEGMKAELDSLCAIEEAGEPGELDGSSPTAGTA